MRQPPSLLETGGHRLLIIMATEAEYGPCLRQRIQPVITGVGPVEAAIGASGRCRIALIMPASRISCSHWALRARSGLNRAPSIRSAA